MWLIYISVTTYIILNLIWRNQLGAFIGILIIIHRMSIIVSDLANLAVFQEVFNQLVFNKLVWVGILRFCHCKLIYVYIPKRTLYLVVTFMCIITLFYLQTLSSVIGNGQYIWTTCVNVSQVFICWYSIYLYDIRKYSMNDFSSTGVRTPVFQQTTLLHINTI